MLDHRLNEEYSIIDEIYFENLRTEILRLKGLKHKEVRKIELGFNQFDFIILTTYHHGDTTTNPIMANTAITNPLLFFFGTINILFYVDKVTSNDFSIKTFLDSNIIDTELCFNSTNNEIRFGVINETKWNKTVKDFYIKEISKSIA